MAALLALALLALPAPSCAPFPVPGPIAGAFAPGSGFGGHWGVDLAVPTGTPVAAVLPGTVTFAGLVVDNLSATVHHGGGLRTSYSFLGRVAVEAGASVAAGDVLGTTGVAHGGAGLHFSLRIGDRYLDPVRLLSCGSPPGPAVRLVSETGRRSLYAVRRAARNTRRDVRSLACRPSHGRRSCAPHAPPRRGHLHHRR